jgi:hypothetical protein
MNKTMNKKLNKIKTEIKAEANKKEKAEVETPRVKLNALQRISGGEIEPKSELRVVCKRLLPVSLAGLFALLSGVAIYTTLRTVLFYRNYGENSALLLSLFLIRATMLSLNLYGGVFFARRSEWGYRFRFIFLIDARAGGCGWFWCSLIQRANRLVRQSDWPGEIGYVQRIVFLQAQTLLVWWRRLMKIASRITLRQWS